MSRLCLMVALCVQISTWAQDQIMSTSGYYEGMNIFVANPLKTDGFGYCVNKVLVNGNVLPASIQTEHFEVNLQLFNLSKGNEVFIELEYGEGCTPRFVNPEVLLPFSTFELVSIRANTSGKISWVTKNESGKLPFKVEQYKWGRWVVAAEVLGGGLKSQNSYSIDILPHSGYNKIRVSQIDNTGQIRKSQNVGFQSKVFTVTKTPAKVKDFLYFKSNGKLVKTKYEVYDAHGNLLKKGLDTNVDCQELLNGIYFINFDNKSEKFIKY